MPADVGRPRTRPGTGSRQRTRGHLAPHQPRIMDSEQASDLPRDGERLYSRSAQPAQYRDARLCRSSQMRIGEGQCRVWYTEEKGSAYERRDDRGRKKVLLRKKQGGKSEAEEIEALQRRMGQTDLHAGGRLLLSLQLR